MTTTTTTRYGNKWTVNEILSLQREYELLNLSIDEIASKHKRTPNAIMFKLDQEQLADYNVLYSNYHNLNSPIPIQRERLITPLLRPTYSLNGSSEYSEDEEEFDDENDEDYVDNADDEQEEQEQEEDDDDEEYDDEDEDESRLSKRVYKLENSLDEIKNMLKSIISNTVPICGIKDCKMSSCSEL